MTTKNRMRAEREALGLTRAEVARRATMDAGTVGKIEARRLQPYDGQLEKIAAALGFLGDAAELLEDVDHEPV